MARSLRSVVRVEATETVELSTNVYLTIEDHLSTNRGRFNNHPVPLADDRITTLIGFATTFSLWKFAFDR